MDKKTFNAILSLATIECSPEPSPDVRRLLHLRLGVDTTTPEFRAAWAVASRASQIGLTR